MLEVIEINYLRKLLNAVKYSKLETYELNQFANSPIGNSILEKLKEPNANEKAEAFYKSNPNLKRFCFEFDNHVGLAIRNRLKYLEPTVLPTIANWDYSEVENFALDILGSINYEKAEFDKLVEYIIDLAK